MKKMHFICHLLKEFKEEKIRKLKFVFEFYFSILILTFPFLTKKFLVLSAVTFCVFLDAGFCMHSST